MTIDVAHHLGAVQRSVEALEKDGQPARAVILSRVYDTDVDDLWDALTSADRIPRWFLPVSGDLKLGGRYQFQGNAGGQITDCEPPRRVAATWEMQGQVSWVDVRVAPEGTARARLTLTHTALLTPEAAQFWEQYGPGAVGTGWEGGFLGMALYLSDPDAPKPDENEFAATPAGRAFFIGSAEAWGEAAIAFGEDPDQARAAARNTAAFYTGQPAPEG